MFVLEPLLQVRTTILSTTNPPDPMTCALAAALLSVMSRIQGFWACQGWSEGARDAACPLDMPACGVRKCDMRGRRGSARDQGCRDLVPVAAGEGR
jgi:hypothetical protein